MKKIDGVFTYISKCCEAVATKPACAIERGQRVGTYLGAKPTGESSLGGWRCSNCRKPCSVSRRVNKAEKETVAA